MRSRYHTRTLKQEEQAAKNIALRDASMRPPTQTDVSREESAIVAAEAASARRHVEFKGGHHGRGGGLGKGAPQVGEVYQ